MIVPIKLSMIHAIPISRMKDFSVRTEMIAHIPTTRMPNISIPTILSGIVGPLIIL